MADPAGKIALRWARRLLIWPVEAALVLALFLTARLLPISLASAIMGGLFGLIGPFTPWQDRARRNLMLAMPDLSPADQRRIGAKFPVADMGANQDGAAVKPAKMLLPVEGDPAVANHSVNMGKFADHPPEIAPHAGQHAALVCR